MPHRVLVADTSLNQLFRHKSDLDGQIAAKKPLLRESNKQKRFVWAKKFKFLPPTASCAMQKRWTNGLYMHGSHSEAWYRRRCDGVGVLLGIYSNLKAGSVCLHPAVTCHPIWFAFSWTIVFFSNRKFTLNTPPGCVRAIWPREWWGDNLIKFIERMPRVCKAVIKAKGGYFEVSKI